MSELETNYQGRKVIVDYAFATDLYEDLDGVTIIDVETGEQIDYDALTYEDMERIREQAFQDQRENAIDYAMMGG